MITVLVVMERPL